MKRRTSQKLLSRLSTALCTALLCFSVTAAEYMPNFKDTDISEFINIVGKNLERTIIVDPNVRGKISVRSYDMLTEDQYYQFFLNVLQVYDFAVVEMPSGILKVVRSKDAKTSNIPVVEGSAKDGDEMITRVVPVYNVPVRELAPILRQLNDQAGGGNVVSHDPSNVMMITGRAAVVNRLVEIIERVDRAGDEEVEIVKLRFASASEMVRIIDSINKSQGKANTGAKSDPRVVADDRTNSVIVSGDIKARQRLINLIERMDQELETSGNTRVMFLNYAKADDLVKVLQGVSASIQAEEKSGSTNSRGSSNRDVSIDAHEDSNALVITAEPDMMRSLEEVVRQLDIRRAQVQVEAIIVEVFEGDGTTLGVQWVSESGGGTQFSNGVIPVGSLAVAVKEAEDDTDTEAYVTDEGAVVEVTTTDEGDYTSLASLLGSANGLIAGIIDNGWGAVVQAVSTDTNSNVLATPHLTTMDNEEAYFIVGQEIPIITGTTTGSNNSNPFQTVDRQEVGIKLKVTPQINEGDAVQLLIEQEVSSVSGATSVDISINKREIKTTVIVDDGGTIVLGGLIDEDVQESVSKVPLLGDIPILGNLFKSTSTSKRKRNLMVFLKPTIVRDGATMNSISHRKYNYIRALQLKRQQEGISLMPNAETPSMPNWDDELSLPPSFEEYLTEKDNLEEGND
ncbi:MULTISPECIES: type II secretion system secretin GspD [Alteromonas]|uniref:Type II secretion system protein GspD n=1 Tax=Alteromonas stellipolaris TaxID=233316 RepID=A0ABM5YNR0_9ALTE|nr:MULTISPECIES: type II secretion system secretin GspD [Alteromonas]AMJ92384.1 type II secretion system protein GspD [Alteromonas sp. Mac2]ALM92652.1 General secretion pathway protein D [Alteromonas stellipolaris LMG 21856]AMJ76099.1 type II secretion system protein GspD [Alteromonas stellipolaris]AMJ88531.1 type II secretion system protein GspD [Alteromonas sp. Mac1]ANB20753.1 type II secretion system protein GspD [Alteromonas stellipolaris]